MEVISRIKIYSKLKLIVMMKCNFITEEVPIYDDLWILGDNFIAKTYREGVSLADRKDLFIKTYFNIHPYNQSKYTSSNRNILSRIENSFIDGLNKNDKLPNMS